MSPRIAFMFGRLRNSPLRSGGEFDDLVDLGRFVLERPEDFESVAHIALFTEKNPVRLLDRNDGFFGKSTTLEADRVDRPDAGGIAVGDHEGRNVLHDLG